jgi:hypothetical protein
MAVNRGLFDLEPVSPPERPAERLGDGQPGKGWRRWGPAGWAFDCADGTRAVTGNGTTRVTFYPRKG